MFIMKKKKEITNASEEENKREPLYTVSENVNWCSHTGNIMQFPLKTEIELSYDPAIPSLGIYLEKAII